jgi:hypothetical protein
MWRIMDSLEKMMIKHGVVIRAIPYERVSVMEARHKDKFPEGVVYYNEAYKRNMLKVTIKNNKGGKFVITTCKDQGAVINNWGKPVIFYDNIEQALGSLGFTDNPE